MRIYYIYIFLLSIISLRTAAQSSPPISKIIIDYYRGGNSWDPGIYGRRELIEFTKEPPGNFYVTRSLFIKYVFANDSVTYYKDTSIIDLTKQKRVNSKYFDNLFNELNTNRDNFAASFIRPFLHSSSRRNIRRIGAKYGDTLTSHDYDNEDRDTIYKRVQRFYMFDSFIRKIQPEMVQMVVIDAYNKARILFIKGNDTTRFDIDFLDFSNYGNHLGQPVQKFHPTNFFTSMFTINLTVNKLLLQILSSKSMLYRKLDFNSLIGDYIRWYLKNKYEFD